MFFLIKCFQTSSLCKQGRVWPSSEDVLICGLTEKHTFNLGVSIQKDLELPGHVTDGRRACRAAVATPFEVISRQVSQVSPYSV